MGTQIQDSRGGPKSACSSAAPVSREGPRSWRSLATAPSVPAAIVRETAASPTEISEADSANDIGEVEVIVCEADKLGTVEQPPNDPKEATNLAPLADNNRPPEHCEQDFDKDPKIVIDKEAMELAAPNS